MHMKEMLEWAERIRKVSPYNSSESCRERERLEYYLMMDFVHEIAETGGTFSLKANLIAGLIDE